MAVKIRLRRTGRKKQPSYRIVVADESTPRDGEYLESLGTYNPRTKPADLRVDLERVEAWLARGARMTDTTASLIRKARRGGDRTVAVRPVQPEVKAETPSVAPVAEPARARAGSRGAPRAAAPSETVAAGAVPAAAANATADTARGTPPTAR